MPESPIRRCTCNSERKLFLSFLLFLHFPPFSRSHSLLFLAKPIRFSTHPTEIKWFSDLAGANNTKISWRYSRAAGIYSAHIYRSEHTDGRMTRDKLWRANDRWSRCKVDMRLVAVRVSTVFTSLAVSGYLSGPPAANVNNFGKKFRGR